MYNHVIDIYMDKQLNTCHYTDLEKSQYEPKMSYQLLNIGEQSMDSDFFQKSLIWLEIVHKAGKTEAHALNTFLVLKWKTQTHPYSLL